MNVQIFGVKNDSATRKAERFFKERRISIHFVDLKVKPASKGELRRFVQKFGIDAVIDRDAKRFHALGLGTAHYGEDRWLDLATEEPLILKTPLVRSGNRLTIGAAEDEWKAWVASP